MGNHTITVKDIKDFVASVEPDAPVGTTGQSDGCLTASTLKWKYPDTHPFVDGANTGAYMQEYWGWIDFPTAVEKIADRFDRMRDGRMRPVTRNELELEMPELFAPEESKDLGGG